MPREEFFNRNREIEMMQKILSGQPRCSVFLGPKNSGKTALLTKVLAKEVEQSSRPILNLDLRGISFNNVDDFNTILRGRFTTWIDQFQEQAPKQIGGVISSALSVLGMGGTLSLRDIESQMEKDSRNLNSIGKLTALFDQMDHHLPESKQPDWRKTPILFIDEANKLAALRDDKNGERALTNFFDWIVRGTKQTHRFHAVLTSSSSFFQLWLSKNFFAPGVYESYTIGNLSSEESERYWKSLIDKVPDNQKKYVPEFFDVQSVCGGHMFAINNYLSSCLTLSEKFSPTSFPMYMRELNWLLRALRQAPDESPLTKGIKQDYYGLETSQLDTFWTKNQFKKAMEMLTSTKDGYVSYDEICKEIGEKPANSLIISHLIHYRPTNSMAFDLPNYQNQPIITAENPVAFAAMKEILENWDHYFK